MKLFIKYIDGKIVDHPFMLDNLQQVYPGFDENNPPEPFVPFTRVESPGAQSVFHDVVCEYVMGDDGIVRDTFTQVLKSPEEQQQIIEERRNMPHIASWIFNETIAEYEPPVPYPDDGKRYYWDEVTDGWALVPEVTE